MSDFVFIEEYSKILRDANGDSAQVPGNPIALHKLPVPGTGTAITSTDFHESTVWILIHSDDDVYYKLGDDTVVADDSDRFLRCGLLRPIYVDSNKFRRLSITKRTD